MARPSGPVSKLIRPPVTFTKKILSPSANISNTGPAIGFAADCGDLGEEAVAIAHDFENAVGQLIPPRVAIEERGITKNAGVLFWRIEIGKLAPSGSGDASRCQRHPLRVRSV